MRTRPNPLAQPKPRTYAVRERDIRAERVIIDARGGYVEIYGHRLDGTSVWVTVSGLDHAAVVID